MQKQNCVLFSALVLLNLVVATRASYCHCEYDYWDYRGYGCVASNVLFLQEFDHLFIEGDHFPLDNDTSVRLVEFKASEVNFIPASILKKFRNLNSLALKNVSLLVLNSYSLDNCENLKNLDLDLNQLQELQSGIFRKCSSLQTLRLASNKIAKIELGAFQGLNKLYYLDIQNNWMTKIPPTALYPLPLLVTLLIGGPNLTTVHQDTFRNNNLSSLHIYNSPIKELHKETLKGQVKLHRLTVFKSSLSLLRPGTFQGLISLTYLMLEVGKLKEIDEKTFSGLYKLSEIDVNWNRIESIHPDAFVDLVDLKFFYVAENNLRSLDGRLLRSNPSVQYIDISSNSLQAIQRNFFDSHASSLRFIAATGNTCIDRSFQQFNNFTLQVSPYFRRCFNKFDELFPAV